MFRLFICNKKVFGVKDSNPSQLLETAIENHSSKFLRISHNLIILITILPLLYVLHNRNHNHNAYHNHNSYHTYHSRNNNHISSFENQDH